MATSEHMQQNMGNTLTFSFPELLHFGSTACYQKVALTLICASSFSGKQTDRSLSSTIYLLYVFEVLTKDLLQHLLNKLNLDIL